MNTSFSSRKYFIGGIIILLGLVYIIKLFALQVLDTRFKESADNNSRRAVVQYPSRGLIYDRNNVLLVDNEAAYDLVIIPNQVKEFDSLELCSLIGIDKKSLQQSIGKAKRYSWLQPSVIVKQLSSKSYAALQEKMYKFSGFSAQTRTLRKYPAKIAGHVLGYVGEVGDREIKNDPYYKSGDYVGINGIEKIYEKSLRGTKGVKIYQVDVHNRIKGDYKDGKYNTSAIAGTDITTSIDAELQAYGEFLMQNKKGSIVAIEPATGEILTLVSSPNYDPNLLVGRVRNENYRELSNNEYKPLFNRALMAQYPPGSTFKLVNALIGLQEGVITKETQYVCNYGYHVGSFTVGCHHNGYLDLTESIQLSCNAYYCNVYRRILDNNKYASISDAYTSWRNKVISFGLGTKLKSDFPNELRGMVPEASYYDRFYGKDRWKSLMLVSMSIGQGELGITPFQMANMATVIANRGWFYTPHIIKSVANGESIDDKFLEKHYALIDSAHFNTVIDGMELVVQSGTATTAKIDGISVCGKTGTAENPHGDDHSIFIAFAPKENPVIAISVYVENAGFGSTWAAPIASLMIEKYINRQIADQYMRKYWQKRIIEGDLMNPKPKVKKQTTASEN